MSIIRSDDQGATQAKMQERPTHQFCYNSNDLKLLKSGAFSDAQVIVDNTIFDVHMAIVCSRSDLISVVCMVTPTKGVRTFKIEDLTVEQLEQVLEFIYSGRIAAIDRFSLADCVELSALGHDFNVFGMAPYARKALWDKSRLTLEAVSKIPLTSGASKSRLLEDKLCEFDFDGELMDAVETACERRDEYCLVVLADVVWAARDWLLTRPVIDCLNLRYPRFGNRVLTTLAKGPVLLSIQADGQLTLPDKMHALTPCAPAALGLRLSDLTRPLQPSELKRP